MYLPKNFEVDNLTEIKRFVSQIASADLVTVNPEGLPLATLMPCIWEEDGSEYGKLIMHMSKGNEQWKSIRTGDLALAIIHGVQAYVSPNNYLTKKESGKVVPTWNYTSVHLSGSVNITHEEGELLEMVSKLTNIHEAKEDNPWQVSDAPTEFISAQLKAIVGITMQIYKVEAKAKLNQNRSDADRMGVIAALSESENFEDRFVAEIMKSQDGSVNKLLK